MHRGIKPQRPCGDCGHGQTRHDRAGHRCRNIGCGCNGYVPLGKKPLGSQPPEVFVRALPVPPPPSEGAAPPPPPPQEQQPPPDEATTPPPIDVPEGGGTASASAEQQRQAAELQERQRKAELLAGAYCTWLKHAQQQLREQGAPLTIDNGIIDEMVYPAAVRVVLREGVADKVSSEDLDTALVVAPAALTGWFKYQAWKESRRAAPAPRPRSAPTEEAPPPPPPRPAPTTPDPEGEAVRI